MMHAFEVFIFLGGSLFALFGLLVFACMLIGAICLHRGIR
jgi:hypothetical protein